MRSALRRAFRSRPVRITVTAAVLAVMLWTDLADGVLDASELIDDGVVAGAGAALELCLDDDARLALPTFAHPAMPSPLAEGSGHSLADERALLMVEPAWRIRVVEVEGLADMARVEYDASLWRATISVRAGLPPSERAYLVRHELIELGLWEYGERVGELIDLFVPALERSFWHRHHANIRNRTVERFGQVVTRAEDGTWRHDVRTPRVCPPSPEQRTA